MSFSDDDGCARGQLADQSNQVHAAKQLSTGDKGRSAIRIAQVGFGRRCSRFKRFANKRRLAHDLVRIIRPASDIQATIIVFLSQSDFQRWTKESNKYVLLFRSQQRSHRAQN